MGGNPPPKQPGTTPAPNTPAPAPAVVTIAPGDRVQRVALDRVRPSSLQPRKEFSAEALQELADSIREQGIVQPLIVRERGGFFELIAGERRWRASQLLKLSEVPIIVREADDRTVLELALIENLQREGLNPIEEAAAYQRLPREFRLTQEEICKRVGKSRPAVANAMRLLELDPEVQTHLKQGRLSPGHAKVLLGVKDHAAQRLLAEKLIRTNGSVRDAEQLVADHLAGTTRRKGGGGKSRKAVDLPPALKSIENKLQHRFSTRVSLTHSEKKGHIAIEYYGSDDLHRLLGEFGVKTD